MTAPFPAEITVNGRVIPAAAIAAEAQNHPAPPGKPGLAWRAAARALALKAALLDLAIARGLHPQPRETAPGRVETAEEALVRQLLEAEITPVPVDGAELRATYDRDPGRFRAPDLWEASHILLPAAPQDTAARAAARALAASLIAELAHRPGGFAALAAEHSACPSRSSGGSLGQIGPGDTVAEVERVLRGLLPGQVAPAPVETRFGLHVLRLDAHAPGAVLPFAAVAPRLRAAAEKAAWVRAARRFAEDVLARAGVAGLSGGPQVEAACHDAGPAAAP